VCTPRCRTIQKEMHARLRVSSCCCLLPEYVLARACADHKDFFMCARDSRRTPSITLFISASAATRRLLISAKTRPSTPLSARYCPSPRAVSHPTHSPEGHPAAPPGLALPHPACDRCLSARGAAPAASCRLRIAHGAPGPSSWAVAQGWTALPARPTQRPTPHQIRSRTAPTSGSARRILPARAASGRPGRAPRCQTATAEPEHGAGQPTFRRVS